MATTLAEHLSLERANGHYVSSHFPRKMGNTAPVAYGGYAIGLAIQAACQSAPDGFRLYSTLGHFLRGASTDAKIICIPVELRRTKSFVTYRVTVQQNDQMTGMPRLCMELLADFHRDEPEILSYSAVPTRQYSHWQHCLPWGCLVEEKWVKTGKLSDAKLDMMNTLFGLSHEIFDVRPCPEDVTAQNLIGLANETETSQDQLSPMAKSSADWFKLKHPKYAEGGQMASVGFLLDGLLSFLPLAQNHLSFQDADACASLDFALRVFVPQPNMNNWHLREAVNHRAGHGRTFSESKLWDDDGNLIASMSQQSILRAPANERKL